MFTRVPSVGVGFEFAFGEFDIVGVCNGIHGVFTAAADEFAGVAVAKG